jgi:hypothetical protein
VSDAPSAAAPLPLARGDLGGLDALPAEAVALFVFEDVRPLRGVAGYLDWRLCGALSQVLLDGTFTGGEGEALLLPATGRLGRRRLFVFGLGPVIACGADVLGRVCRRAHEVMQRAGVSAAVLAAPQTHAGDFESAFVAAAQKELGRHVERVRAILVEQPRR